MSNPMSRKRDVSKPYQVWRNGSGWEWRVLKSYHSDLDKEEARAFCAVSSPYTYGDYDLGDVYWSDIFNNAYLVSADLD
jgi:hypothetical protein